MKPKTRAITRTASTLVIITIVILAGLAVYYVGLTSAPTTSSATTTGPTMTGTSSSSVTIQFYEALAPSEAAYFTNTLIPQFEAENPGIKAHLDNLASATDVANAVEASVQGGDPGTTLVGIDNLVVGELINANATMDLSAVVSAMEPQGLISSATKMVNYESQVYNAIYFLPFRSNVPLVFYNKLAFTNAGIASPPATTTQLASDAKTLSSAGYTGPIMFQGHGGASTPTEVYQWMVQFGGNPFMFNDSGDVQAFQYLYNLSSYFNPNYVHGDWGRPTCGCVFGIAQSPPQYTMLDYQWPYVYNELTNSTIGMNSTTLGVYPGPSGPANGNHLLGGDVLVVPKGATNLAAIEAFAKFLLSAQAQQETLVHLSWVAVNSAAYQNLPANYTAVGTALQQAISQGVFLRNPSPWITQWNTYLDDAWTKIVVNHASYSQIQSILSSENQQLYGYLTQNYKGNVAQLYEQNYYKPISVS